MAGIKGYLNEIEEYVIEAFYNGAQNEEDVVAYVKTHMEANEKDISVIANDFFDFIDFMKDHVTS